MELPPDKTLPDGTILSYHPLWCHCRRDSGLKEADICQVCGMVVKPKRADKGVDKP